MTSAKKSRGRQKVVIARMAKDSNRQVTFSKRRLGLFKKVSELTTLCGAEAGIVVFSPGLKAFSFGHPSVEEIMDRFMLASPNSSDENKTLEETHYDVNVRDVSMDLTALNTATEIERKQAEELTEMRKGKEARYWWDNGTFESLKGEELEKLKGELEELRSKVMAEGVVEVDPNTNMGPPLMNMGSYPMPMSGFDANHGYGHGYGQVQCYN